MGADKSAEITPKCPQKFWPNLSAQAQKFGIFEKKLSLVVRSPWFQSKRPWVKKIVIFRKCLSLEKVEQQWSLSQSDSKLKSESGEPINFIEKSDPSWSWDRLRGRPRFAHDFRSEPRVFCH